jgi:hypothetical protein
MPDPVLLWWGDFVFASKGDRQSIPLQFSGQSLIVGVESTDKDYLYKDIAFISRMPFVPAFGWCRAEVSGVSTGFNLLEFPDDYDYRLDITPAYYVKTFPLSVKIWRRTRMIPVNPPGGQSTTSVRSTLQQTVSGATEVLGANVDRSGGSIFNNGTSNLFIGFGTVASTGSDFKIVPGGKLDIDPSFKGAVSALWQTPEVLAAGAPASNKRAAIYEYV